MRPGAGKQTKAQPLLVQVPLHHTFGTVRYCATIGLRPAIRGGWNGMSWPVMRCDEMRLLLVACMADRCTFSTTTSLRGKPRVSRGFRRPLARLPGLPSLIDMQCGPCKPQPWLTLSAPVRCFRWESGKCNVSTIFQLVVSMESSYNASCISPSPPVAASVDDELICVQGRHEQSHWAAKPFLKA